LPAAGGKRRADRGKGQGGGARGQGRPFPFIGNGKAIALGEAEGMIKTIFDAKTGELLGAHMVGAEVTELIQGYVIGAHAGDDRGRADGHGLPASDAERDDARIGAGRLRAGDPLLGVNSTNFTQFNTQIPVDPNFSVGGFTYDGTYQLILERDVDVGGTDLFLISFPTLDDFVNSTNFTQFNTQIPVDPAFSVGGFTYDGTYQLILERDVDVGGTDLFLITSRRSTTSSTRPASRSSTPRSRWIRPFRWAASPMTATRFPNRRRRPFRCRRRRCCCWAESGR
jgi:hypothetical protein